jgi:hypothetical protein
MRNSLRLSELRDKKSKAFGENALLFPNLVGLARRASRAALSARAPYPAEINAMCQSPNVPVR